MRVKSFIVMLLMVSMLLVSTAIAQEVDGGPTGD